jgi:O-antigen/teichoic acid export membrane protein
VTESPPNERREGSRVTPREPPHATLRRLLRQPLVGDALSLYAMQGLNSLLPLLLLPYLLRVLGPEPYGGIVVAQAVLGYAVVVAEFGFNFSATRDISRARGDAAAVARIFWTTMYAKLGLACVALAIVAAVVLWVPAYAAQWPVFAACLPLVIGNLALPVWYLQGMQRLREAALIQGVARVAVAVATFALVRGPADAWIAALLSSSPLLVGTLAAAAFGVPLHPGNHRRPSLAAILEAIRGSWSLFASSLATMLYGPTNAIVLGLVWGERAVALYNLGHRLVQALQTLATPLTQAAFPRASALFATDPAQAWRLVIRIAAGLLLVVGPAAALLALFAPQLVQLLGGPGYEDAAPVLRVMALTPVLIAALGLPAQVAMVNVGLGHGMLRIYLAAGVANLACLALLVPAQGAVGAAWALLLAETLAVGSMVVACLRARAISRRA